MTKLLNAFVRAHANAWIYDQREGVSDKRLNEVWTKVDTAKGDLTRAIEALEEKVNPPTT